MAANASPAHTCTQIPLLKRNDVILARPLWWCTVAGWRCAAVVVVNMVVVGFDADAVINQFEGFMHP